MFQNTQKQNPTIAAVCSERSQSTSSLLWKAHPITAFVTWVGVTVGPLQMAMFPAGQARQLALLWLADERQWSKHSCRRSSFLHEGIAFADNVAWDLMLLFSKQ
jgi:hypothetical protein